MFASAANIRAERLVPVPDGLAATDAAAVALNYFIAYQMPHRVAGVRPGPEWWWTAPPAASAWLFRSAVIPLSNRTSSARAT